MQQHIKAITIINVCQLVGGIH